MNPQFLKKADATVGSLLSWLCPRPARTGSPLSSVFRLLLIRPGGIGDAVLLSPVISRLREAFPAIHIDVLAEKRNCGAFALCPGIDQVLCYDRPLELRAVLGRSYDVVIDSEQWHRLSAIVARMIRSRIKIGYGTNGRKRLFTHPVGYSHDKYEYDCFFALLKPLGVDPPAERPCPFLKTVEVDNKTANGLLRSLTAAPVVALFPGASIPERCWGRERFRQLTLHLVDEGFQVVVVGGEEDATDGAAIVAGHRGLNLAGQTSLAETAAVIQKSSLLVSGDSGVLHVGVGLDIPTVSLFGPGIAAKWAPRGEKHIVINHELECSPCTKFGYTPRCQTGAPCIANISVDEVFSAVKTLIVRTRKEN